MAIINGLCTLAQARASLNFTAGDTSKDSDIEDYISAATPLIEAITGPMYARSVTFTFNGGEPAYLLPSPISAVTSLTVDGVAQAASAYSADLARGILYSGAASSGTYFPAGTSNVVLVATVGVSPIPPNIVLAARECVREMWQIGRQGNRPAYGNEAQDGTTVAQGYVVSNRVRALCVPNPNLAGFA